MGGGPVGLMLAQARLIGVVSDEEATTEADIRNTLDEGLSVRGTSGLFSSTEHLSVRSETPGGTSREGSLGHEKLRSHQSLP